MTTKRPCAASMSAMMISAEYPPLSMASRALAMQEANVSTSLRHGITIETSTAAGAYCIGDDGRGAVFMALEPNAGCRPRLAVAAEKQVTPTDRLSRTGTCLAACSCSLERFPRGRCQD